MGCHHRPAPSPAADQPRGLSKLDSLPWLKRSSARQGYHQLTSLHPPPNPLPEPGGISAPQQHRAEPWGCLAQVPPRPPRWSGWLLVLAGRGPGRVAVAHPRLGPAPRPPPRRWTRRCRLRWSSCLESRIWQGRLVSQADLYPGVPSRSLLLASCCSCHSCTPGNQSLPNVADGPTRGSSGAPPSRRACTYARSWSIRPCT